MSKAIEFSFVTQIVTGYLKLEGGNKTPIHTNIQVFGEYNPDECSRETGVSYEIKEVYDGYYLTSSFHTENNLTSLFNACEIYEGPVSDKIKERTTKHIEHLTGYSTPDMILNMPEEMPDIAEPIAKITFPNPDTLKTKSA